MTVLVAIKEPTGKPLKWSIRQQPDGKASNVRRGLRRVAEKAYGKKWRALWEEGFRVGVVE